MSDKGKGMRIDPDKLENFCEAVLVGAGVPEEEANIVSRSLVDAEMAGLSSHGVSRLGDYISRMEQGLVAPSTKLEVVRESASTALLDANDGWGQVASQRAVEMSISKARESGSAWVGVRNSNHNGTAAYWAEQIARAGMIGLCAMNTSPVMAAHGSSHPTLGTNPLAIAVPSSSGEPVVLDMATSKKARGAIILAAKNGEQIPEGWAISSEGHPTTDASEALKGSVLPMEGAKGSGLAIMIDILSGVLTGAQFGADMPRMYDDPEPQKVGHIFSALDVESFMPLDGFLERMDHKEEETRQGTPAPGFKRVLMPGDGRHARQSESSNAGIGLGEKVRGELVGLAGKYGVSTELLDGGNPG